MSELLKRTDRLWSGQASTAEPDFHPFAGPRLLEELAPGVAFYKAFVNITAVKTGEGLVLVDTGSYHPKSQKLSFDAVRAWSGERVHAAVYTHGHVDHAYGLPPFLEEATARAWRPPRIVGHLNVLPRMQRYVETAGYNSIINARQFAVPTRWPVEFQAPTETFADRLSLEVGGTRLELHHAKGETDDHTWVWIPQAKTLCTGDLFIWAAPNAGNPQKVQRYALEWARALRAMASLGAELLLPGHGLPIAGAERVREALTDTAAYLESLVRQTLERLNAGETVYQILEAVRPPPELEAKPYLRPVYDEPAFIVRNLWRCFGGWYSGVPSELKPAPRAALAKEVTALSGGLDKLLARAHALHQSGDSRLAAHLVDWAVEAEPRSREAHALRAAVYQALTEAATSTMSKGIYGAAARESASERRDV
ncbi:MAG TPA: alkyl sulfatase dimerization domain-containing protein [Burkholderiales bacterium]|nr:alkyl sulfatase dimerization domain-containing protein [Burkholderiales bacterium]